MDYGDYVRVTGYDGIAFYFCGHPTVTREVWIDDDQDENGGFCLEEEDIKENEAIVVMVGDDREHIVEIDALSPLDLTEFCTSCGQIGCGHSNL